MTTNKLEWWQKTIVYQIYPKSFLDTTGKGTGDLNGIISRLDYLQSLGIGAIWLTPIYPSPMIDNGYDISDYTAIDPAYGTMADFERLIAEADKHGIKIVMDLVYNHTSDQHKWFLESKSSRDNAKSDWYIWRDAKTDGTAPTNWRSIFGGSSWTWCEERQQYYLHTFASQQPDLNWDNPNVRQALYDAANFWIKKGVGGFRIDAIIYIKKPQNLVDGKPDDIDGTVSVHNMIANTSGILDYLYEMRRNVFDGHNIFTVAEANSVQPEELKYWVGKHGAFDMLFEFNHLNVMFPDGEVWYNSKSWKLTDLKSVLTASQAATSDNGWYPIFFENHDQPRSINQFCPAGADPVKSAKAIAAVLLTLRGTPFIYQGQELGMTNTAFSSINEYNDIASYGQYELAINAGFTPEQALKFVQFFSRDNARTPMQWSTDKNAGFSTGKTWLPVNENYIKVNADVESEDKDSVLSWYKQLVKLRGQHEELISGTYEEILTDSEELFAFVRKLNDTELTIIVNFSLNNVELPKELTGKTIILDSETDNINTKALRPMEVRIVE